MERYSALLGKRVEARYRAGYAYYAATGVLSADTGKSIFIEDRFAQEGRDKVMRVEIPYGCILTVEELDAGEQP